MHSKMDAFQGTELLQPTLVNQFVLEGLLGGEKQASC